jgi:hypothetical protein
VHVPEVAGPGRKPTKGEREKKRKKKSEKKKAKRMGRMRPTS